MSENRYFIAVPLPDELKRQLFEWCEKRRRSFPFRRWVYKEDYHITLKYLGACDEQRLTRVKEQLMQVRLDDQQQDFKLAVSGIGTFGRADRPRILWAGVSGDTDVLHHLHGKIEAAMQAVDFSPEDRPYRPHITLAKHYTGESFIGRQFGTVGDGMPAWEVRSIVLYRTDLQRVPLYIAEEEYSLR